MIGQQIDDRRWYGRYDKLDILKRTGGICACCGKKLDLSTVTIEHVIPISRGGYDSESNTIALCKECNQLKGNMLYIPMWFYTAICGTPLLDKLNVQFKEWFQKVKPDFPIENFPLIAPRHNLMLSIGYSPNVRSKKNKKPCYVRDNVLQWHYTGKDYIDEVEAVTGENLKSLRRLTEDLMPGEWPYVALYTCRKLTTNKILALVSCSVNVENKMAAAIVQWSELPKAFRPSIYFSFLRLMFNVFDLGGYDFNNVMFLLPGEEANIGRQIVIGHLGLLGAENRSKNLCYQTCDMVHAKTGKSYFGIHVTEKDRRDNALREFAEPLSLKNDSDDGE